MSDNHGGKGFFFISYHAGWIYRKAFFLYDKESRPHRCEDPVWYGSAGRDQIKGRKWNKKNLKLASKGAWKLLVERFGLCFFVHFY